MNILEEIQNLEDFLLKEFKDKIGSGEEVTQSELERAIEENQKCDYISAKTLINLLGDYSSSGKIRDLYCLVNPESGLSVEIKETIREAQR